mmetsp:Transcript_144809/g.464132  ORF Transcript_144809/g.464132 Transcript_144809/m.464132 type:complete len:164 (+) Transcript_144809:537-1028(+)
MAGLCWPERNKINSRAQWRPHTDAPVGEEKESYGAAPLPPATETDHGSVVMAFVLPLVLVLTMRPRRNEVLNAGLDHNAAWDSWMVGPLAGLAAASLLAVLVGFVLERELSDARLLLVAGVALSALSVSAASQACLHFLVPDEPKVTMFVAFLGLVADPTAYV